MQFSDILVHFLLDILSLWQTLNCIVHIVKYFVNYFCIEIEFLGYQEALTFRRDFLLPLHSNSYQCDPSENCKIELCVPDGVLQADDGKAGLFGGLLLVGEVEQTGAGSGGWHRCVWPTSTTNLQPFRNTAFQNNVIQWKPNDSICITNYWRAPVKTIDRPNDLSTYWPIRWDMDAKLYISVCLEVGIFCLKDFCDDTWYINNWTFQVENVSGQGK